MDSIQARIASATRELEAGPLPTTNDLLQDLLREAMREGNEAAAADLEILLGRLVETLGENPDELYLAARRHALSVGDRLQWARAGCHLALSLATTGHFDEAQRELWTASLSILSLAGSRSRDGALVEFVRGHLHLIQREHQVAEESFAEAALRCGNADDPNLLAWIYVGLGQTLMETAHLEAASHYLSQAAQKMGPDSHLQMRIHSLLARLELIRGDLEASRKHLERGLEIACHWRCSRDCGRIRLGLAQVQAILGEFDASEATFTHCAEGCPDPWNLFSARLGLALLMIRRFDYLLLRDRVWLDRAEECCAQAESLMSRLRRSPRVGGEPEDHVSARVGAVRARIRWRLGWVGQRVEWDTIADQLSQAADRLETWGDLLEAAEIRQDLLSLYQCWTGMVTGGLAQEGLLMAEVERLMVLFESMGASRRVEWLDDWLRRNFSRHHLRFVLQRFIPVSLVSPAELVDTRPMAVMLVDVRGFSSSVRDLEPRQIFERMTELFRVLNGAVATHQGAVLRYFGDGLLAVFEDQDPRGRPLSGSSNALAAALRMVTDLQGFNVRRREAGLAPVEIGVGIHHGMLAVGRIAARGRWEYTAHGDIINVAAHLQQATRDYQQFILITDEAFAHARDVPCRSIPCPGIVLKHQRKVDAHAILQTMRFRATFVGFGEIVPKTPGVVALDVGGQAGPGVLDHHFGGVGQDDLCTASLVVRHPEWVREHLADSAANRWNPPPEFVMHRDPDLDCCVSAWLAQVLLEGRGSPAGSGLPDCAERLADYVCAVDQGTIAMPELPEASPYLLFSALVHRIYEEAREQRRPPQVRNRRMLERGLHFVDALVHLLEADPLRDVALAFRQTDEHPFQAEALLLREDLERFQADRLRVGTHPARLPRIDGSREQTLLVSIENPSARLFKVWARASGWGVLHVIYPPLPESVASGVILRRHVISVDPGSNMRLPDLGARLQDVETRAREDLFTEKGIDIRLTGGILRPGFTSSDPWYDGRGHQFTIVDAPNSGSILDAEQVRNVFQDLFANLPTSEPPRVP